MRQFILLVILFCALIATSQARCNKRPRRRYCLSGAVVRARALKRCRHRNKFVYYSCVFDASKGLRGVRRVYNQEAKALHAAHGRTCVAAGDPHMVSFYGVRWNQYPQQNRVLFASSNVRAVVYNRWSRWGRRAIVAQVRICQGRKCTTVNRNRRVYGRGLKYTTRGRWVYIHTSQAFFKIYRANGYLNIYVVAKALKHCRGDCCRKGRRLPVPNPNVVKFRARYCYGGKKPVGGAKRVCVSGRTRRSRALRRCKHSDRFVFFSCMFDASRGFKGVRKVYNKEAKIIKRAHGKTCVAAGDPHMRSLFGVRWNQYPQANNRLLFASGNVVIRENLRWSRWGRRAIISRVTIKLGRTKTFSLDRHGRQTAHGLRARRHGRNYYFHFKVATIRLYRANGYLNVYVTAKNLKHCKGDCCRRRGNYHVPNPYAVKFATKCRWVRR